MYRNYDTLVQYIVQLTLKDKKSVHKATSIMKNYLNHKITIEDAIEKAQQALKG